jgi:hypothetical protein
MRSSYAVLRNLCFLFPAVLVVMFAAQLWGQSSDGTITGTVTDAQGAVVAGVQIVVQQTTTALQFNATSNSDGVYVVPSLPVGTYEVRANAPGFEAFLRGPVTLDVGQRLRVDIPLHIGSSSQTITITDDVPRLQTEASSLGTIIEGKRIQELPLNGRQPFTLTKLVPGVQNITNNSSGFADSSNQGFSRLRINGGSYLGNQFLLDGTMNTVPAINEISVVPMADSIAEFSVETNVPKAEFGETTGGIINLATKAGGNQVHGTAYEFIRNDAFDARNWFSTTATKPMLRYNQFGGTISGPVWIPRVYNGHNRTFFFFGYEQWHYRTSTLQFTTVPTALQRTGDFSQTYNAQGQVIPLYDPGTTAPNPSGNGYIRQPLAGNIVSQGRMDALALTLLKYMPLPNTTPADPFTNSNNYLAQAPATIDQDVIVVRLDHRFSEADNIWSRYSGNLNTNDVAGFGLGDADSQARNDYRANHNVALGETHVFSPSLLNEFRVSLLRQYLTYQAPSVGKNWGQQIGLPAILPDTEFPSVQVSGLMSLGYSVSASPSNGFRASTIIQLGDSLTWIRGNHLIKMGISAHKTQYNTNAQVYPSGEFTFNGSLTNNPQAPSGTGFGFADFLLGQVAGGQQQYNAAFATSSWQLGAYIQDDIKAAPNLTFNIGVRYDITGPPSERHNYFSTFNPSVINPATHMPGEMLYAGVTAPRTFVDYNYANFAPRAGFAWSFNNRTVLRGAYGIIFNPVESADIHSNTNNAFGFSSTTTFGSTLPVEAFPFYQGPSALIKPAGSSGGPTAYRGQSVYVQSRNAPSPYTEQWGLSLQRDLGHNWTITGSYVGNHGVKLVGGNLNLNQLNPAYYATYGSKLQNSVPNPFYGQILTGPLSGKTISQTQALLPFPDYTGVNTIARHGADSAYHALQAVGEHRYSNGLTVLVSYTKAKLIDNSSNEDAGESTDGLKSRLGIYNPRLDRSLDVYDVSQHLVISGVWDIPFAKHFQGWRRVVLDGWQPNGIITWSTGTPLRVTGANNFTSISSPNLVGDPNLPPSQRSIKKWFNTAAFQNPANYTIGNAPFVLPSTRAPNYMNTDLSVTKNFTIKENWKLQFRTEAFNALNHPEFNAPSTTFSSNAQGVNTNALFGQITSALSPRLVQFGMHLSW